jgi:hypothetical protein
MQEADTGAAPRPIQLYFWGYAGSGPEQHDTLCS